MDYREIVWLAYLSQTLAYGFSKTLVLALSIIFTTIGVSWTTCPFLILEEQSKSCFFNIFLKTEKEQANSVESYLRVVPLIKFQTLLAGWSSWTYDVS